MSSSHVLIINPGSSSIKWELFDSLCAKCASMSGRILPASLHEDLQQLQNRLGPATCVIRFVHGGANYVAATRLSLLMIPELEELNELAPLHNAMSVKCASYLLANFKDLTVIAVFDTEFFKDLPEAARTYGLPMALTRELDIRRYGFHGFAHAAMYHEMQNHNDIDKQSAPPARVITIQLGSGCSMAAISSGFPLDTTMGFTPNEGLLMSTRSGDIDPGLLTWLQRKKGWSSQEIDSVLNEQSGWLGVSGKSARMEELLASNSREAKLAIEIFCSRIRKTVGAFIVVLGGLDRIVVSGGIAENSISFCHRLFGDLEYLGIMLREESMLPVGSIGEQPRQLSSDQSPVSCWIVGNNESVEMIRSVTKSGIMAKKFKPREVD